MILTYRNPAQLLTFTFLLSGCFEEEVRLNCTDERPCSVTADADLGDAAQGDAGTDTGSDGGQPQDCVTDGDCFSCAAVGCPVLVCQSGVCVDTGPTPTPDYCDETLPCASCAAVGCPVVECRNNRCIDVSQPGPACSVSNPCVTCAGLDCPVLECVEGQCAVVDPTPEVRCDTDGDCVSCAGLDCPVLACRSGYCVSID